MWLVFGTCTKYFEIFLKMYLVTIKHVTKLVWVNNTVNM